MLSGMPRETFSWKMLARCELLWHGLLPLRRGPGKRGEMTPQELERLGIAITGSADWIAPLAKVMGLCNPTVVRAWWTGKTKIMATKQRTLFLLAGQPDTPLCPVSDSTRLRLERIMAMREQEHTYESIGQQMGISRQAVVHLVTRYRLVKPLEAEVGRRQCPVCSVWFWPKKPKHRCCSKRCGQIRRRSLCRAIKRLSQPDD